MRCLGSGMNGVPSGAVQEACPGLRLPFFLNWYLPRLQRGWKMRIQRLLPVPLQAVLLSLEKHLPCKRGRGLLLFSAVGYCCYVDCRKCKFSFCQGLPVKLCYRNCRWRKLISPGVSFCYRKALNVIKE